MKTQGISFKGFSHGNQFLPGVSHLYWKKVKSSFIAVITWYLLAPDDGEYTSGKKETLAILEIDPPPVAFYSSFEVHREMCCHLTAPAKCQKCSTKGAYSVLRIFVILNGLSLHVTLLPLVTRNIHYVTGCPHCLQILPFSFMVSTHLPSPCYSSIFSL